MKIIKAFIERSKMKTYKVVVIVEDGPAITEIIKTHTWKSALVNHSIFYKTAIMELACLWLKDYNAVKNYYNQYDIYIDVMEII